MSDKSSLQGGVRHVLYEGFKSFRERFISAPTDSKFKEQRTLTPVEFVQAGDYLVNTYPTWKWYGGAPAKRKNYLGGDQKQCIVIKQVPVKSIAEAHEAIAEMHEEVIDGELGDWLMPSNASLQEVGGESSNAPPKPSQKKDILSLSDDDEDDPNTLHVPNTQNRRTYDLYITYDITFKVPRLWLVGSDSSGNPLTAKQVCEDISQDHAGETVTWEQHPHEDFPAVSIHPCRHAVVMKNLLDAMEANGNTVIVDHYLLVFLKFITAVIPTIEYDYSLSL